MNDFELAVACRDAMYEKDRASQKLGIEVNIPAAGSAIATMTITKDMVNGFDICHGGLVFTVADTAFAFACNSKNRVTVAADASIDFLQPVKLGDNLTAIAKEVFRGGSAGLTQVTVKNQLGETVALFRGRSHTTKRPLLAPESE